jgi:hypothetical protein
MRWAARNSRPALHLVATGRPPSVAPAPADSVHLPRRPMERANGSLLAVPRQCHNGFLSCPTTVFFLALAGPLRLGRSSWRTEIKPLAERHQRRADSGRWIVVGSSRYSKPGCTLRKQPSQLLLVLSPSDPKREVHPHAAHRAASQPHCPPSRQPSSQSIQNGIRQKYSDDSEPAEGAPALTNTLHLEPTSSLRKEPLRVVRIADAPCKIRSP